MSQPTQTPGIGRRLASMLYESLLLAATLFVASFLFLAVAPDASSGKARLLYQAYLILVAGCYFIWFWLHGGQTLPMKTWKLRLVNGDGLPLTFKQACLRYVLALIGVCSGGIGILWAWFDKDGQFLHDRLSKTRIVDASKNH